MTYGFIDTSTTELAIARAAYAINAANRDPDNEELNGLLSPGEEHPFTNTIQIAVETINPLTIENRIKEFISYQPGLLHIKGVLYYKPRSTLYGAYNLKENIMPFSRFIVFDENGNAPPQDEHLEGLLYQHLREYQEKVGSHIVNNPPETSQFGIQREIYNHPQMDGIKYDVFFDFQISTISFYVVLPFNATAWHENDNIFSAIQDITDIPPQYSLVPFISGGS